MGGFDTPVVYVEPVLLGNRITKYDFKAQMSNSCYRALVKRPEKPAGKKSPRSRNRAKYLVLNSVSCLSPTLGKTPTHSTNGLGTSSVCCNAIAPASPGAVRVQALPSQA
jgi:hypothetical protein